MPHGAVGLGRDKDTVYLPHCTALTVLCLHSHTWDAALELQEQLPQSLSCTVKTCSGGASAEALGCDTWLFALRHL